jgi:hypothetical protein
MQKNNQIALLQNMLIQGQIQNSDTSFDKTDTVWGNYKIWTSHTSKVNKLYHKDDRTKTLIKHNDHMC